MIKVYTEEQKRQDYVPRHSPPKNEEQNPSKKRRVSGKTPDNSQTATPPRASSSSTAVTYDDIAKAFGVPQATLVAPSTPTAKTIVAVEESPVAVEESPAVDNPVVQEYTDVGQDAVIRVYKDCLLYTSPSPRDS